MSTETDPARLCELAVEVMETAARLLRNGDNPYRVAHYLDEATSSTRAVLESLLVKREQKSVRVPVVGCTNVRHNAVDCQAAGIPINRWCEACSRRAAAG